MLSCSIPTPKEYVPNRICKQGMRWRGQEKIYFQESRYWVDGEPVHILVWRVEAWNWMEKCSRHWEKVNEMAWRMNVVYWVLFMIQWSWCPTHEVTWNLNWRLGFKEKLVCGWSPLLLAYRVEQFNRCWPCHVRQAVFFKLWHFQNSIWGTSKRAVDSSVVIFLAVTTVKFANDDKSRIACASVDSTLSICQVIPPPATVICILRGHMAAVSGEL